MATKIAWRHPGLKPLRYIQNGLEQAVSEWIDQLDANQILALLDETDANGIMDMILGK